MPIWSETMNCCESSNFLKNVILKWSNVLNKAINFLALCEKQSLILSRSIIIHFVRIAHLPVRKYSRNIMRLVFFRSVSEAVADRDANLEHFSIVGYPLTKITV